MSMYSPLRDCRSLRPLAFLCLTLALLLSGCVSSAVGQDASPAAASSALVDTPLHTRPPVPPLDRKDTFLTPVGQAQARSTALALQKDRMGLASWTELAPSLERSLAYTRSWPQDERAFEHSGRRVNWREVTASLELLQTLLPRLDNEPELLAKHFQWLHLTPQTHFTAYYSPSIKASRTRKPGYEYPIYRLPEELAPGLAHCLPTHTCPEEAFAQIIRPETPYFSRAAIDLDNALAGRGLEMAWLQHPFDTYLLMLEGSGMLHFDDGSTQAALFAGLNGNRGQSMAGYLIRTGQVARKDADMEGLRRWWDANPGKRRAFLEAASGYAFFRYGADSPRGTAGCELTPWVSMAVDEQVLPLGGILAYELPTTGRNKAGVGDAPVLRGLGFAHDTGSAIKLRRIDLYAGEGEDAHQQALSVYTKGHIWLLMAK